MDSGSGSNSFTGICRKMPKIIWDTDKDATIEIVSLTDDYIKGAVSLLNECFYPQESVCRVMGLSNDLRATAEIDNLVKAAAADGLSLVALERISGKVVGVTFNKVHTNAGESFYRNFARSCENDIAKDLVMFIEDIDSRFDIFEHCKIDCFVEIMFLSVHTDWRGKDIATLLCQNTIKLVKKLYHGEVIKIYYNDEERNLEAKPSAVCSMFTSPISQRVGQKLNMEIGEQINYDRLSYNGMKFSDFLGSGFPYLRIQFLDIRE